ncbi:hypothetical protein C8J56DRAFT_1156995 [Mycena floridula]|nr:hypothetical protein C8J56DRAFT_1156995 [Mycena floridula]
MSFRDAASQRKAKMKPSSGSEKTTSEELENMVCWVKTSLLPKLPYGQRRIWGNEADNLISGGPPKTHIAVGGATGAGKSSLINAMLEQNIMPTSGNSGEDGVIRKYPSDLSDVGGKAWSKLSEVYPSQPFDEIAKMTVDEILDIDPEILQLLGTTMTFSCPNSEEFLKQIVRYVTPPSKLPLKNVLRSKKAQKYVPPKAALWPLVVDVLVKCNSPLLRDGVVIADLPGVADANSSRSSVTDQYLNKANYVFIVAPVTRASDEASAQALLSTRLMSTLASQGRFDVKTMSFIVTKADGISPEEYADPESDKYNQLMKDIEVGLESIAEVEKIIQGFDERSEGATVLRRPKRCADESLEADRIPKRMKLASSERARRLGQLDKPANDLREMAITSRSDAIEKCAELQKAQKDLNTELVLWSSDQRAKIVTDNLVMKFREMFDEARGQESTSLITDSESLILPVFIVSSRDYARMTGLSKDSNGTSFADPDGTQIPLMQEWMRHLAQHTARVFRQKKLSDAHILFGDIKEYLQQTEDEAANPVDLVQLCKQLRKDQRSSSKSDESSIVEILTEDFMTQLEKQKAVLKSRVRDILEEGFEVGKIAARAELQTRLVHFIYGSNRAWNTNIAVLRRSGCYGEVHDLNTELVEPFHKKISTGWSSLRGVDLFKSLGDGLILDVQQLVARIVEALGPGVEIRATNQGLSCLNKSRRDIDKMLEAPSYALSDELRNISLSLAKDYMSREFSEGYEGAMKLETSGKGAFGRRVAILEDFVKNEKHRLFESAGDHLLGKIDSALDGVIDCMKGSCREQAKKVVELYLSPLWLRHKMSVVPDYNAEMTTLNAYMSHIDQLLEIEKASEPKFTLPYDKMVNESDD